MEKEVILGDKKLILRSSLYSFVLSNPKENETFKGFLEKLDFSILNDAALLTNLTNTIVELLKTDKKAGGNKGDTFR